MTLERAIEILNPEGNWRGGSPRDVEEVKEACRVACEAMRNIELANAIRTAPQISKTSRIERIFRAVLNGEMTAEQAIQFYENEAQNNG